MGRLTLFVKGNVDVHDALHSCVIDGVLRWNGINDVVRARHPGTSVRVRHETWTRSDALLAADGTIPGDLCERQLALSSYPLASQFSTAVFDTQVDAYVLSIQPDVTTSLMRHRTEGYFLYPDRVDRWSEAERSWLRENFERAPQLDAAASMANMRAITERIRQTSDAPILIFNLSPVVPGETIHCYEGLGETFSTRARRFNLALAELSEDTGVSIVDVDTILARAGADTLKIDAMHLAPDAYALLAEEVVRILADHGLLSEVVEPACTPA